jgi:hypothetical protein
MAVTKSMIQCVPCCRRKDDVRNSECKDDAGKLCIWSDAPPRAKRLPPQQSTAISTQLADDFLITLAA